MGRIFVASIDLEAYRGKAVELLRQTREGETFVDRSGHQATVTPEDLDETAANFAAGTRGQDVPIDIDHEYAQAAGWLKEVWVEARDFEFPDPDDPQKRVTERLKVLKARPEWNKLGQELVGDKIYKYFSVSINLDSKELISASLVNFPAVKGLKPAELAEGASFAYIDNVVSTVSIRAYLSARIHYHFTQIADNWAATGMVDTEERIELSGAIGAALSAFSEELGDVGDRMIQAPEPDLYFYSEDKQVPEAGPAAVRKDSDMTDERKLSEEEVAVLREEIRREEQAKLKERDALKAELRTEMAPELRAELEAEMQRHNELVTFAEQLCNGDHGLAERPEDVVEFLESLPETSVERAKAILQAKVVDFGEVGSSRDGRGALKALHPVVIDALAQHLDGGGTLEAFFQANAAELGEMGQYDLSGFKTAG